MLQFGNKEFRNLQEQVLKNMKDIQDIEDGATVLAEFGIKVIGQVDDASELPDPATYEGEYGDAFIVGTEEPYEYYIFTRAFEGEEEPQWFDLGIFPQPGPQGEQGPQGEAGVTPNISVSSSTSTLSPGSSASVTVSRSGTNANPTISFAFGIPQGAQGIQGSQGPAGATGERGPQGLQGPKGDPGYLYTIIGQEDTAQDLPDPSTVRRDSAFLIGYQEPYDVYVIIGTDNLEWISLGQIATVEPQVYVASDTYSASGTLDASTLASIIASTDMHYIRDGSILFQRAGVVNGVGYYTSIGIDTGSGATEVGYFALDLSDGSWEVSANTLPTDVSNYVTTNTAQTITADKTMDGAGINFTDSSNTNPITFKLYLDNYNNLIVNRAGQPSYLFATSQLSGMPGGTKDLGSTQYKWNDAYLGGKIYFQNGTALYADYIEQDSDGNLSLYVNNTKKLSVSSSAASFSCNAGVSSDNAYDLGTSSYRWKDAYIAGNISDGTNTVAVSGLKEITANPTVESGETPTSLTGLQIGSTKYSVSAGGGDNILNFNSGTTLSISDSLRSAILNGTCGNFVVINSSEDGANNLIYMPYNGGLISVGRSGGAGVSSDKNGYYDVTNYYAYKLTASGTAGNYILTLARDTDSGVGSSNVKNNTGTCIRKLTSLTGTTAAFTVSMGTIAAPLYHFYYQESTDYYVYFILKYFDYGNRTYYAEGESATYKYTFTLNTQTRAYTITQVAK